VKSNDKYCNDIEAKFSDLDLQSYLIEWVDENIVGRKFLEDEIWTSGGIKPGYFWLPDSEVDWVKFNFWERSQVRFIGPSYDANLSEIETEIKSIFFAERSRKGVLVRMPDSTTFGVNDSELRPISDRVAVYCMQN